MEQSIFSMNSKMNTNLNGEIECHILEKYCHIFEKYCHILEKYCHIFEKYYQILDSKTLDQSTIYVRKGPNSFNEELDSKTLENSSKRIYYIRRNQNSKNTNLNSCICIEKQSNQSITPSIIGVQSTCDRQFLTPETLLNENEIETKQFERSKFEEYVYLIVGLDLNEQEKKLFKLPDYPNKTSNYFLGKKFTNLLEQFSQKCVTSNLGIIVEAELKVDSANNEQAYIHIRDNLCDAKIPNLLLRKYALHGDIVRCFVRKSFKATEPAIGKTTKDAAASLIDQTVKKSNSDYLMAFVIKIVKRVHNRLCVGTFLVNSKGNDYIMFEPRDKKLPLIKILRKYWPKELLDESCKDFENLSYVGQIVDWNYPTCIGKIKSKAADCRIIDAPRFQLSNNLYDIKPLQINKTVELNPDNTPRNKKNQETNRNSSTKKQSNESKARVVNDVQKTPEGTYERHFLRPETFLKGNAAKAVKSATKSFEEYVNEIVGKDLNKKKITKFKFPDYPNKTSNYFLGEKFTNLLEQFSQKCVTSNLGIIVEAELKVDSANNEQAYIHIRDNLCDAKIPNLLLRKYALHGDIVRCFVRKSFKATEPAIGKTTKDAAASLIDQTVKKSNSDYLMAFVIKIVKRVHNRLCVGTFLVNSKGNDYIMFEPRDKKLPLIKILRKYWPKELLDESCKDFENLSYVGQILDWSYPTCIGKIKSKAADCRIIDAPRFQLSNNLYDIKPLQINKTVELNPDNTPRNKKNQETNRNSSTKKQSNESKARVVNDVQKTPEGTYERHFLRPETFLKGNAAKAVKPATKSFEEYVNEIVGKDLNKKKITKFKFPDYPNKTSNYFLGEKFTNLLEQFSQKCVANNLGIIVETKLDVNINDNEQAFIRYEENLREALIPNLLMRKCALHGDIVRCFVNKNVKIENSNCLKAFVIKIKKKVHKRLCPGTFIANSKENNYIMFAPLDKKLPLIKILRKYWPKELLDENFKVDIVYIVKIFDWNETICVGKIKRTIGSFDNNEVKSLISLYKRYDLKPYANNKNLLKQNNESISSIVNNFQRNQEIFNIGKKQITNQNSGACIKNQGTDSMEPAVCDTQKYNEKVNDQDKCPAPKTFEEYVNSIISLGLNEQEKELFKFPDYENQDKNYFMGKKFTRLLEQFSQKCVDNNLGMIVDAVINVSSCNNEQAYIRIKENSCDALIPNFLLRKFALDGDIVRCFVRKSPSKSDKNEVATENALFNITDQLEMAKNSNYLIAFVIHVIQKVHNRFCVGTFIPNSKGNDYIMFEPQDKKLPLIKILRKYCPKELLNESCSTDFENILYVAEIRDWVETSFTGSIWRKIGRCGEIEAENFISSKKTNDFNVFSSDVHVLERGYKAVESTTYDKYRSEKTCNIGKKQTADRNLDISIKEKSNEIITSICKENKQNEKSKDLYLNAEMNLIIDLLKNPSDSEREKFLTQKALEYRILIKNDNYLIFNEELIRQRNTIKENTKKENEPKTFEDYVNLIIGEGLNEEQKELFRFPDYKNKSSNYFISQEFNLLLEQFVEECVSNDLGLIVEAKLNVDSANNEQAYIRYEENLREAMIPNLLLRKCALDGDIVRCFVRKPATKLAIATDKIKEDQGSLVQKRRASSIILNAFVIKIIRNVHNRFCIGTFIANSTENDYSMFEPRDKKLPLIRILHNYCPIELLDGDHNDYKNILYVAEITDWNGTICMGKVIHRIGLCGGVESEKIAILLNNNLYVKPYQEKFNKIFEKPLNINETDLLCRRDMRPFCVFTIDPLLAKDLDDALSIVQYPDGNFEVGIHIADVSHFIEENSELDNLIQKRTTSIYLVDEVFHMLPKVLCKKCALLPEEDRLTFSVFLKITPDAQIIETNIQKTIIKSCTQFAYEHAQKIIDNPEMKWDKNDFPEIYNGYTITDIAEKIKNLHNLATIFRKNRFENGCLSLNKTKISFTLDNETGEPTGFSKVVRNTANFLIEEFMILANQTVASFLHKSFPSMSILRYHLPPRQEYLKVIKKVLQRNYKIKVDITTLKTLATSIQTSISIKDDPASISEIINHFLVKPMPKASYVCSGKLNHFNFYHYALAIPLYTHFTSPIRRYPDILVHRLVNAAINHEEPTTKTLDTINEILNVCNTQKNDAKKAKKESIDFYFMRYIKTKEYLNMRSVIIEIDQNYCYVLTLDSGHLIKIDFCDFKEEISFLPKEKSKTIIATFLKDPYKSKSIELILCNIVWLKIYVKENNLKGTIIMPPTD